MNRHEQVKWSMAADQIQAIPGAELVAARMRRAIRMANFPELCRSLIIGDRYPEPVAAQIRAAVDTYEVF